MPFPPRKAYTIPLPGARALAVGERTLVMGVLNVTPDSFADGGVHFDTARAVNDGLQLIEDGADIIDVGGESTRPGAEPVAADEELRRVLPVVERLATEGRAPVSIDTYKAVVAREAVARGASIVNDISALTHDELLAGVVAETGAALLLMHNRGHSADMYRQAVYGDVVREIAQELEVAISRATRAGVRRGAIMVDPGIGFAKRAEHSYAALSSLERLTELDRPVVVGPSRKSFLRKALGDAAPSAREWGTAAAVAASVLLGAHIIRVHGVREMVQVVRVADQIRAAAAGSPSA